MTLYLQPQISGFLIKGGFVLSVAHAFDEALIRSLGSTQLTAYAKFPLFENNFFGIKPEAYPGDIFYVDESANIFRNHTFFVKLKPRKIDYESDFSIWSFNPELARMLPALELSRQSSFPANESYYLLQSADPENSTGYLVTDVKLDGLMFQHVPDATLVSYACQIRTNRMVMLESKVVGLLLGERLVFNGYFKFGTSGSPFLNSAFEVIGLQSSALYTQYKYSELFSLNNQSPTMQTYQGYIFNRCVAVKMDKIRDAIEKLAKE